MRILKPSRFVVTFLLTVALMGACAAQPASAQTVVSLGFDDGYTSQYDVRSMLASHGMHGTFFMISGNVGDSGFMTWSQLAALEADGNEIGGHTVDHVDLTTVSAAVARQQVCDDRAQLQAHGLHVTDFAYPYGNANAQAEQAVKDCGYDSARTTLWYGFTCPFPCTESIPPRDPFATTVTGFSDQTLPELQTVVTNAEVAGGWAQIVIHQVCDSGCAISPSTLNAFLDWLASRVTAGAIAVKTVHEVMSTPPAPPDTSITAGPSGVTNVASPSFSFTSDASSGVTFTCRLDGPGAATGSWGACTSPKGYASLADGSYTFRARATTAAGTDQTPASRSFTVDATAPAAPVISVPAQNAWNASGTIVVSGTAEAGSTVELFEGASSRGSVSANGMGSWSRTLTGVPDGSHTYTAKARDAAGNTSVASAQRTVNVDTSAPQVTIGAPVEGARLRLGQVVFADYSCSDEDGAANVTTCTGPVARGAAIDTATPGAKSFTVEAEDQAGNTSSETVHYVVDDSAPQVTITTPAAGASYARGASVPAAWSCSDDDGAADIDASPARTFGTQPPGGAISTATLGVHAFSVTCTDLAGNATTKSIQYTVIDKTPPEITINVPVDGAHYQQGQVVAPDYACSDPDGVATLKSCMRADGATGPLDTSTLGPKSFTVNAEDLAGNTASSTVEYTVDPVPPAANLSELITALSPGQDEVVTRGGSPTFEVESSCEGMGLQAYVSTGSAVNGAGGFVDVEDEFPMPETSLGSGIYQGAPHGDWLKHPGIYYWQVRTVADCGDAGEVIPWASVPVRFRVVGASVPAITITRPVEGAHYQQGQQVTADFACSDDDGSADVKTCAGTAASGAAVDTGTPGAKSFTVSAEDREGHVTARTVSYVVDQAAPPATRPAAPPPATQPAVAPPLTPPRVILRAVRTGAAGRLTLTFGIPSPGVLVVSASAPTTAAARTLAYAQARRRVVAGVATVTLTPTAAARRVLRRHKTLRVRIRSVFTPDRGGSLSIALRTVTVTTRR